MGKNRSCGLYLRHSTRHGLAKVAAQPRHESRFSSTDRWFERFPVYLDPCRNCRRLELGCFLETHKQIGSIMKICTLKITSLFYLPLKSSNW